MPIHAFMLVLSSIVPWAEHFLEEDDCPCPPGVPSVVKDQCLLGGGDQTTQ